MLFNQINHLCFLAEIKLRMEYLITFWDVWWSFFKKNHWFLRTYFSTFIDSLNHSFDLFCTLSFSFINNRMMYTFQNIFQQWCTHFKIFFKTIFLNCTYFKISPKTIPDPYKKGVNWLVQVDVLVAFSVLNYNKQHIFVSTVFISTFKNSQTLFRWKFVEVFKHLLETAVLENHWLCAHVQISREESWGQRKFRNIPKKGGFSFVVLASGWVFFMHACLSLLIGVCINVHMCVNMSVRGCMHLCVCLIMHASVMYICMPVHVCILLILLQKTMYIHKYLTCFWFVITIIDLLLINKTIRH